VGAIAILFLFVVMLLNIKLVEIVENATRYVPIGGLLGLIFLYEIFRTYSIGIDIKEGINIKEYINITKETNIERISDILYTEYYIYFIISSLILLVSMIGAIVLCLYHEKGIKRQDLFGQCTTEYNKTIKNIKNVK
jgi:NADH-quinone oxidoreductase subunit J